MVYTPLALEKPQIRILILFPGNSDDQIKCELNPVYLDEKPYYEVGFTNVAWPVY